MNKTTYYDKIIGLHEPSGTFLQLDKAFFVGNEEVILTKDFHCVFAYELKLFQHDLMRLEEVINLQQKVSILFDIEEETIIQFYYDLNLKKLIVFYKFKIDGLDNPIASLFLSEKGANNILSGHIAKKVENCIRDLKKIETSEFVKRKLNASDIVEFTKRFLFQDNLHEDFSRTEISKNIISSSIEVSEGRINVAQKNIKTYSIKDFFEAETNEPDLNYGSITYLTDFLIEKNIKGFLVSNCFVINKAKKLNFINSMKSFFLDRIASRLTEGSLKYKHFIELLLTRNDIHNDIKYIDSTFHLITLDHNDPNEIKRIFMESIGARVVEEDFLNIGIYETSIPCQFHSVSNFFTKRNILLRSNHLSAILPIFGEFEGHDKGVGFFNRFNQEIKLNIKSEKAGHICVLSSSGGGKSTLINKLMSHYNEEENAIIIKLDFNTTSREKAKASNNYEIIEVSESNAPNCLTGDFSKEKIEFIKKVLLDSIKICDVTFKPKIEHSEIIENAIKGVLLRKDNKKSNKYKNMNMYLEEIILEIETYANSKNSDEYQKIGSEIINKLDLFHGDGLKADIFRGQDTITSKKKDHIIYDFYNMDNDSSFMPIVTALVIHDIKTRIKKIKERNPSAWGFIVFEELNYLSKNSFIAEYFDYLVDVVRKENFQIVTCSASWDTFTNTKIGKKAFNMSSKKIIGEITRTEINNFIKAINNNNINDEEIKKEIENNAFNEAVIQTIKSLKMEMNLYADFLYLDEFSIKESGVIRYIPTQKEFLENASGNKNYNQIIRKEFEQPSFNILTSEIAQ